MTDPFLDLVDLRARRALEQWERSRVKERIVHWYERDILVAADADTVQVWEAASYVELADMIGLGVRA